MDVNIDTFMAIMESFVSEKISPEDFIHEHNRSRMEILDESDLDPSVKEALQALQRDLASKAISSQEFARRCYNLRKEFWDRLGFHPFSRESDILLGELVVLVDLFDAPSDPAYPDISINEAEFREAVKKALDELIGLKAERDR